VKEIMIRKEEVIKRIQKRKEKKRKKTDEAR